MTVDERDIPPPLQDELPPVRPPSAGFILQLFVVPGLIVLALVGPWLLFMKLVSTEQDWKSLVSELKHPNEQRRWRAAHGLAQVLRADQDLGRQGQHLSANAEMARSLSETLSAELKKGSQKDPDLKFQAFLARTLGLFDLPDIVLPPLEQAIQLNHEREKGDVREQVLEIRKNALGSVAVLAGRMEEQKHPVKSTAAVESVIAASESEDKLVRQVSAFTLGLLDTPEARSRLNRLLDDPDELTQINAAVGLVRHGDTRGLEVLKDVLSRADLPPDKDPAREFERLLSMKNAVSAAERIAPHLSAEQRTEIQTALKKVSEQYYRPEIRVAAAQALKTLGK